MPNDLVATNVRRRRLSRSNPGLILFLLDQSGSMQSGNKLEDATRAVNEAIYEIYLACNRDDGIRNYCRVGVIGYGARVDSLVGGWIRDVALSYAATGKARPVYVEPRSSGGTPMAGALSMACEVASTWVKLREQTTDAAGSTIDVDCQNSFPPVVVNITDGAPDDFRPDGTAPETEEQARRLRELSTQYGNLLLFNAHISGTQGAAIKFPAVESEIVEPIRRQGLKAYNGQGEEMPAELFATLLFNMSSTLSGPLYRNAENAGFAVKQDSRGFVFNADTATLIRFMDFGTSEMKNMTE